MGVLAPPIHIKGHSGIRNCVEYIEDPHKIVSNEQTMQVLRYMVSHCVQEIASVGYHGCSGIKEVAVEQFRIDEKNYRTLHPARKDQHTEISVLQYLEVNHKRRVPKRLMVYKPDCILPMPFEQAQQIWWDSGRSEEERSAARETLRAHTLQITKSETMAEHLVLSLHPSDNPTPEELQAVVDEFMSHPCLSHFKAVGCLHWNEQHKHAHLLINNYGDHGKKLCLSGTRLRELRRHLDKCCYAHGFSIIDSREARLDPSHSAWIDEVRAEGKVRVWRERDEKCNAGSGRWKAAKIQRDRMILEQLESRPRPAGALDMMETLIQENMFLGFNSFLTPTFRSQLPGMVKKTNGQNRKKLLKNTFYCVQPYVFDTTYHRRHHRSLLELIFELAKQILVGESQFLAENYPPQYAEMELLLRSPVESKIQTLVDGIRISQDLNVRTPKELDQRIHEVGMTIGNVRKAIAYDETTIRNCEAAYQALELPQMLLSPDIFELRQRESRARQRIIANEAYLLDLNRCYRDLKKTMESLKLMQEQCHIVHSCAQRASQKKPELSVLIQHGARKQSNFSSSHIPVNRKTQINQEGR